MQFLITEIVGVCLLVGVVSSCPNGCDCNNVTERLLVACDNIPTDIPNNTYAFSCAFRQLTSLQSGAFNDLPSLVYIFMHNNSITTLKSDTFNNLPQLDHLDLSSNNISVIEDNVFNNLPNLTIVRLSNNPISFVSEHAFENLPQLASLKFDMHCGSCQNIPFWRWLKGNHTFTTSITCNDFDGKHLSDVQLNNVTDCLECSLGYYGHTCNMSCDGCLSDSCDSEHGICTDTSGCKPGWQPGQPKCDIACSKGHFGKNCNDTCDGCISELCNRFDGVCDMQDQCKAGWQGVKCDKACSKGHFGNNCNDTCDGCISELCNSSDGVCDIQGLCKAGWHDVKCDKECTTGRYGVNCDYHCQTCVNRICSRNDGSCKYGCIEGFKGEGCHSLAATKSDDTAVYTGVVTFAATALVAVIIVLLTLRYRGKKRQQKSRTMREDDNATFSDDYVNSELTDTILKVDHVKVNCRSSHTAI